MERENIKEVNVPNISLLTESIANRSKIQQDEEKDLQEKRLGLLEKTNQQRKEVLELQTAKDQIEAEIVTLKLRDAAYQKEHSDLRYSINVVKFQIEKIKEDIAQKKASEMKDLENFEKAVDDIAIKFRSSPHTYDRQNLMAKLEKEEERRNMFVKKIEEIREKYSEFCREAGLREKEYESENLIDCVLPGSSLHNLIEMERNLSDVIASIRTYTGQLATQEKKLKELDEEIAIAKSKITELKSKTM